MHLIFQIDHAYLSIASSLDILISLAHDRRKKFIFYCFRIFSPKNQIVLFHVLF